MTHSIIDMINMNSLIILLIVYSTFTYKIEILKTYISYILSIIVLFEFINNIQLNIIINYYNTLLLILSFLKLFTVNTYILLKNDILTMISIIVIQIKLLDYYLRNYIIVV